MKITISTLLEIIPANVTNYINRYVLLNLVHKFYCNRMTMNDLCTGVCSSCAGSLIRITKDLHQAKNIEAFLTYKAKDETAINMEKASERKLQNVSSQENDLYEFSDVGNPFESLKELFQ